MNKKMANEWLKASQVDLLLIEEIIHKTELTQMVAFHAQQSIEKSLKAILEYHKQHMPKKHDLLQLKDSVSEYINIESEVIFERLNELYIDSRYPGNLGLLPNGEPTLAEAKEFYETARDIHNKIRELIK